MHIPLPVLHLFFLLSILAGFTTAEDVGNQRNITPNHVFSSPFTHTTPAPDPLLVARRLVKARQGDPRPSDGRTNFIGWYSVSNIWVSAVCQSSEYFAADAKYGVCCPRSNIYCDLATTCGGLDNNFAIGPYGQADCGPSNTCDTITMLQTQGGDDARSIIFCIPKSEQFALPNTWYRVTYPLPQTEASTVTVTLSSTVTATVQVGNSTVPTGGPRSTGVSTSAPNGLAIAVAAVISFLAFMVF
ncbi:uncharacterized protein CTRU02_211211 [Colletotrichum truncatum]|uniref:Uncharacterized protein n=1 Tax=Colletotrichum truncatum TaxID=5467 RepID=A0ACC3YTD4_COLTU|nr:uncharacterized protein CTRU02_01990 [Colletotrichum truncatum]KAF6799119.1 hypothetical protein CTRU02_01990 [Colletotrichum truncatum]